MDGSGLFVIIVPLALSDGDAFFADPVNEPVLIIDPSAPFPFRAAFYRFRLSFTGIGFTLD